MNELIKINYDSEEQPMISARELHDALKVKTRFNMWIKRMIEYGFTEGADFWTVHKNVHREDGAIMPQIQDEYNITISMAKEICMLQRNEKGKEFRRYFIEVEKAWNTPEMVMNRALEMSRRQVKVLMENVNKLTLKNAEMQPKAEYYDALVDKGGNTNIRDTAKELGLKQNDFIQYLIEHDYLYRDKKKKLLPTARSVNEGLMEIKEWHYNTLTGNQTFITPKGKQKFMKVVK